MSSVDERIVEMRFDNQQFESGVQKSIHTLDQLKDSLNLESSAKSLEQIQNSVNLMDFSQLASNVGIIANRFSFLGNLKDKVFSKINEGLIDMTRHSKVALESLTVGQIQPGFDKYERKIQSVQTIMNATEKDVDYVNERLDKLNWFTDETSYSLVDMVDNISKFTSSGVELDTSVTAMIGIANAAGLAGASVGDASHAMEGFSKAIAQGNMNRQNWQWIKTAHMDTMQFKKILLDAAASAGEASTIVKSVGEDGKDVYKTLKGTEVTVADFESAMSEGWLTTDAMLKGLSKFGGAAEEIYQEYLRTGELTSDIIDRMGGDLDELGLKAFRASQEAKTFSDAVNSVKDAVSTGWMRSFEYIFGNKEEATKLWTEVANEMWEVFASGAERRNEILKYWHDSGGYESMLNAIRNAWEGVKAIGEAVKETFSSLFPEITGEKLVEFTQKFEKATEKFKEQFKVLEEFKEIFETPEWLKMYHKFHEEGTTTEQAEKQYQAFQNLLKIKNALGGLVSIFKLGGTIFKAFGKLISPLAGLFNLNTDSVLDFAASLGSLITNIVDSVTSSEFLRSAFYGIQSIIKGLVTAINFVIDSVKSLFQSFSESEVITGFFNSIKTFLSSFTSSVGEKVKTVFSYVSSFVDKLKANKTISKSIESIITFFTNLKQNAKLQASVKSVTSFFTSLKSIAENFKIPAFIKTIQNFWRSLIDGDGILAKSSIDIFGFTVNLQTLRDTFAAIFKGFDFTDIWGSIVKAVNSAKEKIMPALETIGEALANVNWGKVAAIALAFSAVGMILQIGEAFTQAGKLFKGATTFITESVNAVKKFASLPDRVGKTFDALTKAITDRFKTKLMNFAQAAVVFAGAVLIMAGALTLISTIPKEQLIQSGIALGAIAVGLGLITGILGSLGAKGKLGNFKGISLGMIAIAASIAILVGAIKLLQGVDDIGVYFATIVSLMAALAVFLTIIDSAKFSLKGSGGFFLTFSTSILILVGAFKLLSTINGFDFEASFTAIAGLMALMAAFAVVNRISKSSFGFGAGILSITIAMLALMHLVDMLGKESISNMIQNAKKNIVLIAGIFASLALFAALNRTGSNNSLRAGAGILAVSVALVIVYNAIKKFGKLRGDVLFKGIAGISAVIFMFSRFAKALETTDKGKAMRVGSSILAMSAALLIVYLAVKNFGALDLPELGKGVGAVFVVVSAFGKMLKSVPTDLKAAPIVALTAALLVLFAGIAMLTLYEPMDLLKSVVAISAVLLAFGGAMALMGKGKFDKAGLVGFSIGVTALITAVGSLYLLKDIPMGQLLVSAGVLAGVLLAIGKCVQLAQSNAFSSFTWGSAGGLFMGVLALFAIGTLLMAMSKRLSEGSQIGTVAASLSGALLAISGAIFITSGVPKLGALKGLGVVIAWIFGIAAILGLIGVLGEAVGMNENHLAQVELFGRAVGGLIGSMVDEFNVTSTANLPEVAANLTGFIEGLSGFFEGIAKIPEDFGENFDNLTAGLSKLSNAEFKDALANLINSWAGGEGEMPDLASNVKKLGEGLKAFQEALADVKPLSLKMNVASLASLIESMGQVGKEGGIFQSVGEFFGGTQDFTGFSEGAKQMGGALQAFQTAMANVKTDDLTAQVKILSDTITAFNEIPSVGGWADTFSGTISWENVSKGLSEYGEALKGFSDSFTGENGAYTLNDANIDSAIEVSKKLSELLKAVPPIGGLVDKICGKTSWESIGKGLEDYGDALVKFSEKVTVNGKSALNTATIQTAIDVSKKLSELLEAVPPTDGVLQKLIGEKSWSTLGAGLVKYGTSLVFFDKIVSLGKFDSEQFGKVTEVSTKLASILDAVPPADGFLQKFIGEGSWETLGKGLVDFGKSIVSFSDTLVGTEEVSGVDLTALTTTTTAVETMVNTFQKMDELGMTDANGMAILNYGLVDFATGISEASTTMAGVDTSGIYKLTDALTEIANVNTTFSTMDLTTLATTVSDFVSGISDGFTQASSGVTASGENFVSVFCKGITDKKSLADQAGGEAGTEAVTGASSAVTNMEGIGWSAVSGLVKGISDKTSDAYDAGLKLGTAVADGVRAGLDVNSPSRVMMQIGEFAGQGLGIGLSSMSGYVSDSAEKMAEGSILSVSSVFDKIDAALSGDIDYSPVITPVLDLSAISYGASQIDGILNQDASLRMAGQIQTTQTQQDIAQFLALGNAILKEIQNGSDLYFDDGAFAGRINRRLGSI